MKVLLIENEINLLKVWSIALGRLGYSVQTADSLASARDQVVLERFDYLIADFHLDDGEFSQLGELIAKYQRETQVIVISGMGKAEIEERMFNHERVSFLEKPVTLKALSSELERLRSLDVVAYL